MKHSDPILTLSNVTTKDSGNYSCSLRNFKTTVSEEFRIYIEDVAGSPTVLIIVVSLISLGFIIAAVMLIRRKAETRGKPKEEGEENQVSQYSTHQTTARIVSTNLEEAEDVLQEVQYESVNIQPKELLQMSANTAQENDSAIYSTVYTLLYGTLLYSTLLYSTLLYSTLLYSTLVYSTLLYSTLVYSSLLYSTLVYSTLLYSSLLYSTLLYSTLLYLLYSTLLYSSLLYSTLLYSTLVYSTLLYSIYSTLVYSTLVYSTLLYSTLLYSTLVYSTLVYSTLLYLTLLYSTL
ncbi:unnamed protein product [Leuciscus chuanchicus]